MSGPLKPRDLVGVREIAKMFRPPKGYRTAQLYVARRGFPKPWGKWALGRLWLRSDVQKWIDENPARPPGRPTTKPQKKR